MRTVILTILISTSLTAFAANPKLATKLPPKLPPRSVTINQQTNEVAKPIANQNSAPTQTQPAPRSDAQNSISRSTNSVGDNVLPLPNLSLGTAITESDPQTIFSNMRPIVFRVSIAQSAKSPTLNYGMGFAVSEKLIATSYHVISSAAISPEKFKAFTQINREIIETQVVAVDVINDLALLESPKALPSYLTVPAQAPNLSQGEKVFSIGQPNDLDLGLVEGNFNGTLNDGIFFSLVLSSPLNRGMSGGPTVNKFGQLVGVNKAVLATEQNVSLLAAPYYLNVLVNNLQKRNSASNPSEHLAVVESQLVDVQSRLTKAVVEKNEAATDTLSIQNWKFINTPTGLKCRSALAKKHTDSKIIDIQACANHEHATPLDGVEAGHIELVFMVTKELEKSGLRSPAQQRAYIEIPQGLGDVFKNNTLSREDFTDYDCNERTVANSNNIPLRVRYCVTAFKKFKNLNSAIFKIFTLNKSGSTALAIVTASGFKKDSISSILKHVIESISQAKQGENQ